MLVNKCLLNKHVLSSCCSWNSIYIYTKMSIYICVDRRAQNQTFDLLPYKKNQRTMKLEENTCDSCWFCSLPSRGWNKPETWILLGIWEEASTASTCCVSSRESSTLTSACFSWECQHPTWTFVGGTYGMLYTVQFFVYNSKTSE